MTLNRQQAEKNLSELQHISLLEEKLQVARRRQKVGEVIIRKQVETRMVQLPIRREKLVVEQTGKNPKKLTEVVIAEETVNGFGYDELSQNNRLTLKKTRFVSLLEARELLIELEKLPAPAKLKVRLEITTDSIQEPELTSKVSNICDRHNSL